MLALEIPHDEQYWAWSDTKRSARSRSLAHKLSTSR